MVNQIEGLLSAISRKDQEEIVNMLNEENLNETK